jgi:uncharacterized protein YheU (UPF0270 family)
MSTEVTLFTKAGPGALMSKRIKLDAQGKVSSDGSECRMSCGSARWEPAETAGQLATVIGHCRSDQAIALGSLTQDIDEEVQVTTRANLAYAPGAIARTREHIAYRPGKPAWVLIDYDTKGMPPAIAASVREAGGAWSMLLRIAPGLAKAARVSRASTSAGLLRPDTGTNFPGSSGEHHYVLISDGADADRFLRALHDMCWLNGAGWHMVGGAGQLLERSLIDRMVGQGERLCFEGTPVVEAPLQQDIACRTPQAFEGDAIDSRTVAPDPNHYEKQRLEEHKRAGRAALEPQARDVRSRHDARLAAEMSERHGIPLATAQRFVGARHRGVLLPHLQLAFDHHEGVSVLDILQAPERFVGETLADPLEGVSYGRGKAMVIRASDGGLIIHSFAHGRGLYRLRYDGASAIRALDGVLKEGFIDGAMAIFAQAEMEPDEMARFAESVAKKSGVKITAVKARMKTTRREVDRAAHEATNVEGRILRPRPDQDEELLPTVMFLDNVLARDQAEEPPMRNPEGELVEVQSRKPWSLHLLTADGTNVDGTDAEAIAAPPELALVPLTPVRVELLIERYVSWEYSRGEKARSGSLPRPFIDALMQFSPSAIPVARGINTAPLVAISGDLIEGVGLDRNTGLIHRIDPVLRACVPVAVPTEQDVKEALDFLLNDWLVDVDLSPTGKCVVVLLALTIIERPLLPERPALFVTAGQRGGGKTTLVNMVVMAVLGRLAAAANWSDSLEERKKALFSYLRQGVAVLVWDNISRGKSISCPHIEAALTAPEISDRVLGVSRVESAPATTVQVFTGNSISPCGDMASRSLRVHLDVRRPDPENRQFQHPDPISWSQANRPRIIRALYTLLVAGAAARPANVEAKTRFKSWWRLVGWPVEWAAGLAGIKVDCNDLIRDGEGDDEEASATGVALEALHAVFDGKEFTTAMVRLTLYPGQPHGDPPAMEEARIKELRLADALAELAGRPLSHQTTARELGKLFQKSLTGRPAWIYGGVTVAILKKTPGDRNNSYRIELQPNDGGV